MPLTQAQIEAIPLPFLKKIEALEVDTMTKISERMKGYADIEAELMERVAKREAKAAATGKPLAQKTTARLQKRLDRAALMKELRPTDLHKLNQLANIGFEVEDFEKQLNTIFLKSDTEIYTALKKSIDFKGTSQELDDLVKSVWNITTKDVVGGHAQFENISRTAGFVNAKGDLAKYADFYRDLIDKATLEIRTGATDFNSAMRSSLRAMADRGLSHVSYSGGMVRRADTSVRSALMGASSRLNAQATAINMRTLETSLVEVTVHSRARPSHQKWQGKIFEWVKDGNKRTKYPDFVSSTGYGTGDGFGGWNCYHRILPFIDGVSEPTYTAQELRDFNAKDNEVILFEGKEYNAYDAQQMQRKLETAIRTQKDRTIIFAHDKDELLKAKGRLATVNAKYTAFSKAMGIPVKPQRISVAGYRKRK